MKRLPRATSLTASRLIARQVALVAEVNLFPPYASYVKAQDLPTNWYKIMYPADVDAEPLYRPQSYWTKTRLVISSGVRGMGRTVLKLFGDAIRHME